MEEVSVSFDQIVQLIKTGIAFQDQLVVIEFDGRSTPKELRKDLLVRLDALSIILVAKGEMIVTADYLPYRITQHMTFELTHKHLLNSIAISHDTKGYYIIFSKVLLREMFPQLQTIPKEYIMNKRLSPITKLDPKDFGVLVAIIERLQRNIQRSDHVFHRGMVMNEVGNFIMELTDMGMKQVENIRTDYKASHNEELAMKFIQLIASHGKEWNEVSQYSTELCVTPVYLSRAIKSVSGKTVMEWINEARIAEAKILLRKPGISIQEIAEDLNFSDQSAFGKFFKKHTGMPPLEYKRRF